MISSPRSERTSLHARLTDGPAFIADRFGSARGLARLWLSQAARTAGRYRAFERIEWARVERLVFVCTGNICRSPYAEQRARRAGHPAISIALRGETGRAADPAAISAAGHVGIDLSAHCSTEADKAELRPGDLFVAMEPWQALMLRERWPDHQVTLLGLWSSPKRPHLHDPYTLSPAYFRACFRTVDSGVAGLLGRVTR